MCQFMFQQSVKQMNEMQTLLLLISFTVKHIIKQKQLCRQSKLPRRKTRFSTIFHRLSDFHFSKMYRMPKPCFMLLCEKIKSKIGENEFKSEAYCDLLNIDSEKPHIKTHQKQNDDIICGEMKLLITLRLLSGASYLDLMYF